jgi:hypothetical protein
MEHANPAVWDLDPELAEDMNSRTQHSMLFTNPNGSKTSYISSNLHYEARAKEWEPQKLEFLLKGSDHVVDQHWFDTNVNDAGVSVVDKQNRVGVQWLTNARPSITGRSAELSENGVSWQWLVGPRRLKLEGIVPFPLGVRTHSFPYQPLEMSQDFSIVDGVAKVPGLEVAKPVIIGANGLFYETHGWSRNANGPKLEFTFDDGPLPPEAYPYVIDPTTTLRPDSAGLDGYITAEDGTNHGTATALYVGDVSGAASHQYRVLIEFDLSSIPSTHTVSDVTLSLYEASASDGAGTGSWACNFHLVLVNWIEAEATWTVRTTGVTWNAAGCSTDGTDRRAAVSAALTLDGSAASAYVDWSGTVLTQNVQDLVDGTLSNNYGWILEAPNAENQGAAQSFNQFESSDLHLSARRPRLVVVHAASFTPRMIVF